MDAVALRYLNAENSSKQNEIIGAYCNFLEKNTEWLISSEGQLTLQCFIGEWIRRAPNLENRLRVFEWFAEFVDDVQWMDLRTLYTINSVLSNLPFSVKHSPTFFTKKLAIRYLIAVNACEIRMKRHPNWKNSDQETISGLFKSCRQKIMNAFPEIVLDSLEKPQPSANAVSIKSWLPDPSLTGSIENHSDWIESRHLRWDGERLLIPLKGSRMISLDPSNFRASSFAFPIRSNLDWSMAETGGRIMLYADEKLQISYYNSAPGIWKEISVLGLPAGFKSNFKISAANGFFYLGAIAPYDSWGNGPLDTALIGQYVDGKFDWIVSSNRRPEKHPLDTLEPQSFRGAFSGYNNRTMVIAGATNEWPSRSVYDLESGELVANLGYGNGRYLDGSGDLPVAYGIDRGDLMSAFVFDPTKRKPTVLIKKLRSKGGLGSGSISWDGIKPVK